MSAESTTENKTPVDVAAVTEGIKGIAVPDPIPPVSRGISGEVKWFSFFNGYGFITREDTGKDIFVHRSAIVRSGRFSCGLIAGTKVEFDVIQGFKGPEAWTVTAPNGEIIQNVSFIRHHFHRNGKRVNSRSHKSKDGTAKSQKSEKSEENNNRRQVSPDGKNTDLTESDGEISKTRHYRKDGRKNSFRNNKSKRRNSKSELVSADKQSIVSAEKIDAVVNEIVSSA